MPQNTDIFLVTRAAHNPSDVLLNASAADPTHRQVVGPRGIGSAEAFGVPSVTSTVALEPAGIVSGETFGTPTVHAAITVFPVGIVSAEAGGIPTLLRVRVIEAVLALDQSEIAVVPSILAGGQIVEAVGRSMDVETLAPVLDLQLEPV